MEHAKELPWWCAVLECAAEWGIPPWDLLETPGYVKWSIRRREYRNAYNKHESIPYRSRKR